MAISLDRQIKEVNSTKFVVSRTQKQKLKYKKPR